METGRKSLLGAFICTPEEGRQGRWGMGVGDMLVICAVFCISLFLLFTNLVLFVNAVFVLTTCSLFPLTVPYSTFLRTVGTKVSKEILCIKIAV